MRMLLPVVLLLLLLGGAGGVHASTACPAIDVQPSSIDFRTVTVGDQSGRQITLRNGGDPGTTLTIIEMSVSGTGFIAVGTPPPFSIAVGDEVPYAILARPLAAGVHAETLTIRGEEPCTPAVEVPLSMDAVGPPDCDAGPSGVAWPGDVVTFDGSGSSYGGGPIIAYEWAFGDGATARGAIVDHQYVAADAYTLTLQVTNDDDLSSICTTRAVILGSAACDAGGPYQAINGFPLSLVASSGLQNFAVDVRWEFGDGSTVSGPTVTHTYEGSGSYWVTLCVIDVWEGEWCCGTSVEVFGPSCAAGFPYEEAPHYSDLQRVAGAADVAFRDDIAFVACAVGVQAFEIRNHRALLVGTAELPAAGVAVCVVGDLVVAFAADRTLWTIDAAMVSQLGLQGSIVLGEGNETPKGLGRRGSVVYAGTDCAPDGGLLHVVDVAQPDTPELLTTLHPGLRSLAVGGDRLYVGYGTPQEYEPHGGVQLFDISTPESPVLAGSVHTGTQVTRLAVDTAGARLYAGTRRPDGYYFGGVGSICVIDVADAQNPVLLDCERTFEPSPEIDCQGSSLYVIGQPLSRWDTPRHRLWHYDVSGNHIPLSASLGLCISTRRPFVHGSTLVTIGNGLMELVTIGREHMPGVPLERVVGWGQIGSLAMSGNHVYSRATYGEEYSITEWNVVDVVTGARRSLGNPVGGLVATGGYLYAYVGRLRVFDLSEPLAPQMVAVLDVTQSSSREFVVEDDLALLPAPDGLYLVSVAMPQVPEILGSYGSEEVFDVAMTGRVAYVATGAGIDLVDLTEPLAPARVGTVGEVTGADALAATGGLLFAADRHRHTVTIIDVHEPSAPEVLAEMFVLTPTDLCVQADHLYVATQEGMQVVDVSQPRAPRFIGLRCGSYQGTRVITDGERVVFGEAGTTQFQGWTSYVGALFVLPTECDRLPNPVLLSSFAALPSASGVWLTWSTTFEQDLLGFRLRRRSSAEASFRPLHLQLIRPGERYEFLDRLVHPGVTYHYELEATFRDGSTQRFGPVRIHFVPGLRFAVGSVRPNPVLADRQERPSLAFELPGRAQVSLRVYDVSGRLVRSLVSGWIDGGAYRPVWDLLDERGRGVASGVYYFRLQADSGLQTRPVVVLR